MKQYTFLQLFISIFLLFGGFHLSAQEIRLKVIDNPDNINIQRMESMGNVLDVHIDRFGFVWYATSYGLSCYDGYETKTYLSNRNIDNSLPDDKVHTILEDRSGTLWISTLRGFCSFNRSTETFTSYFPDTSALPSSNNNIFYVIEDSQGLLWVFTEFKTVAFNPETAEFIRFPEPETFGTPYYNLRTAPYLSENRFFEDEDSNIWVCISYITWSHKN